MTERYVEVRVATFPPGYKDAADLLESVGGDAKWEAMIAEAKPIKSWAIQHLSDRHDLSTTRGTVEACADIVDHLLVEPPVARARYVRELADKLDMPEYEIRQTLDQVIKERSEHYQRHPQDRPKLTPVWERDGL